MQANLAILTKKAIDCALKSDWKTAVELNHQILERDPNSVDAKIRLGRCLLQLREFSKAKKIFKEILSKDPINAVAKKNIELASKKRVVCKNHDHLDPKSLLMEPGKSSEVKMTISTKGITSNDFEAGESLILKTRKKSIEVLKFKNDTKVSIGYIENKEITQIINSALNNSVSVCAAFIRGKDKDIVLLLRASLPIFRSERQEVRPYLKKGSFEETDNENEEVEIVEE